MKAFYAELYKELPLREEMVEAQIEGMNRTIRGNPSFRYDVNTVHDEIRELIMESMRLELTILGLALYKEAERAEKVGEKIEFRLTHQKSFIPDIAERVMQGLWPVSDFRRYLDCVYEWYVRGLMVAPQHFRKNEWELVVDGEGDLFIRLTGRKRHRTSLKDRSTRVRKL